MELDVAPGNPLLHAATQLTGAWIPPTASKIAMAHGMPTAFHQLDVALGNRLKLAATQLTGAWMPPTASKIAMGHGMPTALKGAIPNLFPLRRLPLHHLHQHLPNQQIRVMVLCALFL
jgi:hypothetical protein